MYSLVIKIAIDVSRALELVDTIPMLEIIIDIAEVVLSDPDPNNNSVTLNNNFFLFKLLYFSLKYSLSILIYFEVFSS